MKFLQCNRLEDWLGYWATAFSSCRYICPIMGGKKTIRVHDFHVLFNVFFSILHSCTNAYYGHAHIFYFKKRIFVHLHQIKMQAKEGPYYDDITKNEYQNYYAYLASEYLCKRDILLNTIQKYTPMTPVISSDGFFIMADTTNITNEMYPTFSSYLNDSTEGKLKNIANCFTILINIYFSSCDNHKAMPTNPMPRDWAISR